MAVFHDQSHLLLNSIDLTKIVCPLPSVVNTDHLSLVLHDYLSWCHRTITDATQGLGVRILRRLAGGGEWAILVTVQPALNSPQKGNKQSSLARELGCENGHSRTNDIVASERAFRDESKASLRRRCPVYDRRGFVKTFSNNFGGCARAAEDHRQ